MKLDFNDLLIVPKELTDINTRTAINPFDENGFLPLITAPMDTVINSDNAYDFYSSKINVCTPRGEETGLGFSSYSYFEIKDLFERNELYADREYLIDVANGHMDNILNITKKIKDKHPNLQLMVGNVANPKTYALLSEAGANYVRVGIGNGCFIDGTLVTTITTKKSIENITIGEKVLTHTGEYRDVLETKKIPYSGKLIVINDDITCSPDHEFYVLNKKYLDIINDENIDIFCEWVSALELLENPEYLLIEHNNFIDKTNEND